MQQFYIGQSKQYITAQYAKSARSTCRQCKQKIAKQQVRIGLLLDDDHYAASYWYHLKCFYFKPRHKVLLRENQEMIEKIYRVEDLDHRDCDKVVKYLKEEFQSFRENKSGKKNKREKEKDKKQTKEDQQQQNESQNALPEKNDKKSKKPKIKKSKLSVQKRFMSPAQTKRYNEYLQEYSKLSSNQLKEILQKNNQAKTGTKDQLAAKCADGKLFGRIPNCSKCNGGKLRFNHQNGEYKCPGYMEDTEFVQCDAKFDFDDVKREEWME